MCHATSTFANKYPSSGTNTAAKLFSFHRHANQMLHTFGTTPKHVASCGYVEMRDKFASMFWCDTLARGGTCHFDAHLLKAACCQVVAKTVKGLWTALSESKLMSWSCRRLRVTTQRVVLCLSNIASRCCDTRYSLCAFLSNMRQNWHSGSAVLVVFLHCDGRQTSHPFRCLRACQRIM